MKRDWDLIRRILLTLEQKADRSPLFSDQIANYDAENVAYHFKIMNDAGLIDGENSSVIGAFNYTAYGLTWQGHEFLDQIRNDSIWNKIKSTLRSKSIDLSFDVIKTVATVIIKNAVS
ncbi:DUF2513 domain-containing protein [Lonepinella sp. BR2930]|uniref:DUF2513 domain-containing protein n=1 Tax=Lonepinella sp. BR2930 TaxID=3434554 RepID=UPI003F6DB8D1